MHAEGRVDVFNFVSRIRNQRCQLVQTDVRLAPVWKIQKFFTWTSEKTPSLLLALHADAVLVYLSSFAGALPVWRHRAGRFLPGGPPAQTPQYSHTHGQSGARRGIQSNEIYLPMNLFLSGRHNMFCSPDFRLWCFIYFLFFCRNWLMFASWRKTWELEIFRLTWGKTEYCRLFRVRKLFSTIALRAVQSC